MAKALFCLLCLWFSVCSASQVDDVSVAHVYADIGSNVSLPCLPQSLRSNTQDYTPAVSENTLLLWIREGKTLQHSRVEENGILALTKITRADSGIYTCQAEESFGYSESTFIRNIAQVELHVKSMFSFQLKPYTTISLLMYLVKYCVISATPPAPAYLTVYPSSVLALVTWKLNSTGGYPIKSISVIYQEVTDDWNNPAWHRTYPEELKASIVIFFNFDTSYIHY